MMCRAHALSASYFLTARQEVRFSMQWAGIRANEQNYWEIPLDEGFPEMIDRPLAEADADFGISQLSAQLRYRWEIAPLSDLFVVYTRGSKLVTGDEDDFEDFFRDALTEPLVDLFVVKLRYRFGT